MEAVLELLRAGARIDQRHREGGEWVMATAYQKDSQPKRCNQSRADDLTGPFKYHCADY